MAENSKIEWTDHTFNPWWGCTAVSAACDFCYAEALSKRFGKDLWGNKPRQRTSVQNWNEPVKWNRQAEKLGIRYRVFCASMADVFDNQVPTEWRDDLWALIRAAPNLDWLLLTKRPQNITKMLPADWGDGYPNVWLGMTAENQEEFKKRISSLLDVPAVVHFLSCEPLLGPIYLDLGYNSYDGPVVTRNGIGIDWVICGGESGTKARPMHVEWARSLRDQCQAAGVAFHFKQWGEWHADAHSCTDAWTGESPPKNMKIGKKKAGRLLDGRTWDEFPEARAA